MASTDTEAPWHARSPGSVLDELRSSSQGLSPSEAEARLARYGPNRLRETPGVPVWRLALDEVRSPLVLILLGAAALLLAVSLLGEESHLRDVGLILAIVVLNAILGFVQNYRAQRGIESLRRLASPTATVLRDGGHATVDAGTLVPGDVVLLEEGDRVPADGRILEAHELRVDEAALTGESLPVGKSTRAVPEDADMAERGSMAYLATVVVSGRGRVAVTATGMATEVGEIAESVQTLKRGPTRFQREVADLGRRITVAIAVLIVAIVVLRLTVGDATLLETFVAAVALAVAAIPEGLPVVMTLALAFGTRRMLERNALVRSLPVVEILGAAEIICADKTGTITEGRMSLREVRASDRDLALLVAGLCSNAYRDAEGHLGGDPTDVALRRGAEEEGADLDAYRRTREIPFSSARKMMTVVVESDGRRLVLSKGAPEALLDRCTRVADGSGPAPLDEDRRRRILAEDEELAATGFRVLGLAYREDGDEEDPERDLVFVGLAGLADPPRPEAAPALRSAEDAGIRVVMITGDNLRTAEAIGREVGLEGEGRRGRDVAELPDEDLRDLVERVSVFARVEPEHKLRILQALQTGDRTIAMTGDGVNDAPALKGADVGIAMGDRGTDVARDAADMVLLDDNFATIVAAIEEGRRIFANIRKFLNYLLTGNLAEVLVILSASLFGYLPIAAVQILWINLITDSGPAVALGVDPPAPGLMEAPPHRGRIISRRMLALIGGVGATMAVVILASFFLGLRLYDLETARTITFTAFVVQEYLRIAVIHRQERSRLFANGWLAVAVAVSLGLHLVLLYTPLGGLFDAVPLGVGPWLIVLGGLLIGFAAALGVTSLIDRRFASG